MENVIRITENAVRNKNSEIQQLGYEKTSILNTAMQIQSEINKISLSRDGLVRELDTLFRHSKEVEPSEDFKYLTQTRTRDASVKRGPKPLQGFAPDYEQ